MRVTTSEEINKAMREVEIAENHLNHCDEDFVESAVLRLSSAKLRLNSLLARAKKSI